MKRVRLIIAYDGTNYCGWQVQINGITVEEVLNKALKDLLNEEIAVIGASRTDSGVHAMGNVAVFDTETRIPAEKISFALNQRLPNDIRIQKSDEVPLDWHPRYRDSTKTYEYKILNRKFDMPTQRLYTHFVYMPLNVEKMKEAIEYFIKKPVDEEYLYYTIKNLNRLLTINRRISPLTGLPGNVQIHAELKKRILNREPFSVLYLDLDNFKAYNDVYGFLKGDEIIEFTAETICKCLHSAYNENVFIGHIGGDDFVGIIPDLHCDKVCQQILATFDAKSLKFFTQEDREKGYIEVANRKGIIEQFPLTSLSIGVVVADVGRFHNILEIGEVGAQVKHAAKSVMGSSYAIDRRKEG